MHFGKYYLLLLTIIMGILGNAHASVPVPYAGKVSIDGVNFDGQLKFMFAIYTASNDMVWDSERSHRGACFQWSLSRIAWWTGHADSRPPPCFMKTMNCMSGCMLTRSTTMAGEAGVVSADHRPALCVGCGAPRRWQMWRIVLRLQGLRILLKQ